jgi:hypothetical protein
MPANLGCTKMAAGCYENGRSEYKTWNCMTLRYSELSLTAADEDPYDIRKKCDDNDLCYDVLNGLEIWANRPDVRAELGVDDAVEKYESCQNQVGFRFGLSADG